MEQSAGEVERGKSVPKDTTLCIQAQNSCYSGHPAI